jgi:NAD(P)-dependent dehydrogenase (short-subunit alcohol dehydrogenase family)
VTRLHSGSLTIFLVCASSLFLEIETYEKGWDRCFNVCFHGVVYMTRAFLPVIIKQTEGYILNISSINAFWTW